MTRKFLVYNSIYYIKIYLSKNRDIFMQSQYFNFFQINIEKFIECLPPFTRVYTISMSNQ